MTSIATKGGAVILKGGAAAESCSCCESGWYCCMDSKCVSGAIKSVSASITASDWSYQLALSSSCGTKYASAYFKGSAATSTISLAYDGSSAWSGIVTGSDCYVAIRYVPYFVRTTTVSGPGNLITIKENVARLEVQVGSKTVSNTTTLKTAADIACGATPSLSTTLSPNAAVADELHPTCIDRLSPLTAIYSIPRPNMSVSSDCSGISTSVSESGSNQVSVTITPSY